MNKGMIQAGLKRLCAMRQGILGKFMLHCNSFQYLFGFIFCKFAQGVGTNSLFYDIGNQEAICGKFSTAIDNSFVGNAKQFADLYGGKLRQLLFQKKC